MNKISFLISLSFLILLGFLYSPFLNTEADTPPKVIDITTSPSSTFVDMKNLKPGDSIIHDVKILNSGNSNFSYISFVEFKNGSREYFNRLFINVKDHLDNTLYSGLLKDFTGFSTRILNGGTAENLVFEIIVPSDIENNLQGLSTSVLFKFSAQGNADGNVINEPENGHSNGSPLPKTATNTFNSLLVGIFLLTVGLIIYIIRRKLTFNNDHS